MGREEEKRREGRAGREREGTHNFCKQIVAINYR